MNGVVTKQMSWEQLDAHINTGLVKLKSAVSNPHFSRGECQENYTFCDQEYRNDFGARRPIVDEPLTWAEEYPVEWREPRFDLAELAVLRWIEGLSRKELAERFGKTECAIQNHFQELKRKQFRAQGLSETLRKKILCVIEKAGC